jgi:hypothetical protein
MHPEEERRLLDAGVARDHQVRQAAPRLGDEVAAHPFELSIGSAHGSFDPSRRIVSVRFFPFRELTPRRFICVNVAC